MKTNKIFYCASRIFPVCYKVDPKEGIIESVKNWSEYPKAVDRFRYSAVFARELKASCKLIKADEYERRREFVTKYLEMNFPDAKLKKDSKQSSDKQKPKSAEGDEK